MPSKLNPDAIVTAARENADRERQFQVMGEQLTTQYHRVEQGYRDMVILGAMLEKVYNIVSTCGHDRSRGGGRDTAGQGLKGWLETYAPDVPRARAYEFLKIATGLREAFQVGVKTDMAHLLQADASDLPAAQAKKQKAIFEAVDGTSRRQLLFQFGGVGVPECDQKARGGKRDPKKLTPEERAKRDAEQANESWQMSLKGIDDFFNIQAHTRVSRDQREQMINVLKLAIQKLEEVAD